VVKKYYTNSGCYKIPQCTGELSLVSINFQAPGVTGIYCLQSQGTGNNITMKPCDPTNKNQLFRVTRVNPGQNPDSLQPGKGQNGIIAQILDRNTGLCVIPGNSTTTTIYNPNYLTPIDSGCSGSSESISGQNVILGECTGGISPGFVWALLPSILYCPFQNGCPGCTGCTGCTRVPGTFNCSGCPGCDGVEASPTPTQIVDISNIDINNIPLGPNGYDGVTGYSGVFKWLIDQNVNAMYYGGQESDLILNPIGQDYTVCKQRPYVAQYINLTTYNIISNEEVCLGKNTTNCFGF
jgi:hypothetical protein